MKHKQYLDRANTMINEGATVIRLFKDIFNEEKSKINADTRLTEAGKYQAIEALKKEMGVALLKNAHTRKQEYQSYLNKAIEHADKVVYAKPKAPHPQKLERFEDELRLLKTELQLSTRASTSFEKLNKFIDKIDDHYLANIVRDQFSDLSQIIMNTPGAEQKLKLNLSQTFDTVRTKFETEEVKEAREVMEQSQYLLEKSTLYDNPILTDAIIGMSSDEVHRYIDKTDEYFAIEGNEKDKPADFTLPEEEQEGDWREQLRKEALEEKKQAIREMAKIQAEYHEVEANIHRVKIKHLEERLATLKAETGEN